MRLQVVESAIVSRLPELDGLRGLAALAVVVFHLSHHRWLPWGWAAVDLFFVLSGYLITGIILRERASTGFVRRFFARRSLRIWPIYYATILVLWTLDLAPSGALAWHLAYLQFTPMYAMPGVTLTPVTIPGFWYGVGHTWTLAVEEQFYLLWPFLGLLAGRRFAFIAVLMWVTAIVMRALEFAPVLLLTRCDGLVLGALLAMFSFERRSVRAQTLTTTALVLAAGAALLAIPLSSNVFRFLMVALICGAILCATLRLRGTRYIAWLRSRPLVWLGTISYGLYLYHNVLRNYFYAIDSRFGPFAPETEFVLLLAASVAVAAASWYFFERPILGLKRHFEYRGTGQAAETAAVLTPRTVAPARFE
jgi:peptidoglycan/LPS O-acetylase OafA/YrhL